MTDDFEQLRNDITAEFSTLRRESENVANSIRVQISKSSQDLFFQIAAFNIVTAGIFVAALRFLL